MLAVVHDRRSAWYGGWRECAVLGLESVSLVVARWLPLSHGTQAYRMDNATCTVRRMIVLPSDRGQHDREATYPSGAKISPPG
jgi:hypothetical protein